MSLCSVSPLVCHCTLPCARAPMHPRTPLPCAPLRPSSHAHPPARPSSLAHTPARLRVLARQLACACPLVCASAPMSALPGTCQGLPNACLLCRVRPCLCMLPRPSQRRASTHARWCAMPTNKSPLPCVLQCLKREKVVRVFKLNTGQDDHAIMFLDDYLKQIDHVISRFEERMQRGMEIFQWFKRHVIDCKLEPSIGHEELCTLLSLGGKVKDEDISLLINAGLLNRQLIDPNVYWFAIPSIGSVLKGISQGRKELISLLKRTKYKEMMMTSLQKKRLRFSSLDMRFHIRDLIGSGYLRTVQSPTGLLVQLSKD